MEGAKKNFKAIRVTRKNPHHSPPVATVIPRSVSMTTLPALSSETLNPRIYRLESLEAKMANIEVSLSNDHQTKIRKTPQIARPPLPGNPQEITARRVHDINLANDRITKLIREVEMLRKNLLDRENSISSLKDQNQKLLKQMMTKPDPNCKLEGNNKGRNMSKVAEIIGKQDRMMQIQHEMNNKKSIIKNLQLNMDKMEANDLDTRIQQAELEYQLEREELTVLNMQQEYLSLQTYLEDKINELTKRNAFDTTFTSILGPNECATLAAVEVSYDPESPGFVIAPHMSGRGLLVQWTRDHSNLQKGDRLVEVNGHFVLGGVRDDLIRVLSAASTSKPLQLIVLRNSSPPRRINVRELENLKEEISCVMSKLDVKIRENKELMAGSDKIKKERDKLQRENTKLGHRISYLEDQVSEMHDGWEDVKQTLSEVESQIHLPRVRKSSRQSDENKEIKHGNVTISGATSISVNNSRHSSSSHRSSPESEPPSRALSVTDSSSPESKKRVNFSHKRTSSTSGVQLMTTSNNTSVVKSPSMGQLDYASNSAPNSEYSRHILQVHVPFATPRDSLLPLVRSASANGYHGHFKPKTSDADFSPKLNAAKLAIHLKVNNRKIALDDFESENEEWC